MKYLSWNISKCKTLLRAKYKETKPIDSNRHRTSNADTVYSKRYSIERCLNKCNIFHTQEKCQSLETLVVLEMFFSIQIYASFVTAKTILI